MENNQGGGGSDVLGTQDNGGHEREHEGVVPVVNAHSSHAMLIDELVIVKAERDEWARRALCEDKLYCFINDEGRTAKILAKDSTQATRWLFKLSEGDIVEFNGSRIMSPQKLSDEGWRITGWNSMDELRLGTLNR